jgi:radical SAM family uncharacterized protein/radical SAM-linked protein
MQSEEQQVNSPTVKEQVYKILNKVNKPSRYIGSEIGSIQKDWNKCTVKVGIAFPDMYEVGISNLGHRILYHLVNKNEKHLADRFYAPSPDFKEQMELNNIPLYGVDSFMPASEFDMLAFSLQYELSYPTILTMLSMGNIPVKSKERNEKHPVIIAGGPGAYNPEPLAEFIDAFIIGDGEDVLPEILKEYESLKNTAKNRTDILLKLANIEGVYVPAFYTASGFSKPVRTRNDVPETINKRISDFKEENYPQNFPVPYSASVHDRAVIEVRRGCGRMCRFCQSCFVNLPVRERDPDEIVELTEKILKNTGYDEYSLLSLSSNDYTNIEELVCELNKRFSPTGASISLPSQRADSFSIDLANQVQSVRKSTLTFAPEAGSQRLRDVINKNLSDEQIFKAVLSSYKAGWKHVKLYFMIGLPTETYDDLDAIIKLIQDIKNQAYELKKSDNINRHLEITCTVSLFVPKPFTPFQWFPHSSLDEINNKIKYLRDKARYLKGVKLNFHDSFLCSLEAVFARGDRELNKLIEKVWQKGSYLDAWNEHFNKNLWNEAAIETGINFEEYSSRIIQLDQEKPWDFINTGVDQNWLQKEYTNALKNTAILPCEFNCVECGVCSSFKTAPQIRSRKNITNKASNTETVDIRDITAETFKYRLKIIKTDELAYISHLDWQSLIYKAIRKAGLKIAFSKGFNPSPKIALGLALPLFAESECEYMDMELIEDKNIYDIKDSLNTYLPESSKIINIVKISKHAESIDRIAKWAKYSVRYIDNPIGKKIDLECAINNILNSESIFIEKINRKGLKKRIDIRASIYRIEAEKKNGFTGINLILAAGQSHDNSNIHPIRADELLKELLPEAEWKIRREALFDEDFKELI